MMAGKRRGDLIKCFADWRCNACDLESKPRWLDDLKPSNGAIELYAKIDGFGKLSCISRRVDPLTMRLCFDISTTSHVF